MWSILVILENPVIINWGWVVLCWSHVALGLSFLFEDWTEAVHQFKLVLVIHQQKKASQNKRDVEPAKLKAHHSISMTPEIRVVTVTNALDTMAQDTVTLFFFSLSFFFFFYLSFFLSSTVTLLHPVKTDRQS